MVIGTYVQIDQGLRTLLFASKSRMAQGVNKLLDVGSLFRRFLLFASVQTLELGKFLPCTLGGMPIALSAFLIAAAESLKVAPAARL